MALQGTGGSRAREFNRLFWNDAADCLRRREGDQRMSIQPNQIAAVSLFHGMLSEDRARAWSPVWSGISDSYGCALAPSDPPPRALKEVEP